MSIAEKLETIAENEQKVYEAGRETGWFESGKKAGWGEFWDVFQDCGNKTSYIRAFSNDGFTPENLKPKYDLNVKQAQAMFQGNTKLNINLKEHFDNLGIKWSTEGCTTFLQMIQSSEIKGLPEINAASATSMSYGFAGAELEYIEKFIVSETTPFSNTFSGCHKLTYIMFEGIIGQNGLALSTANLSYECLMSIINCLKDYSEDASTTAHTVTLGTTNLKKLTDEEKAIATEKGWTLA